MIKMLISCVCAGVLALVVANGQVSTVTGNESTGRITDYTPDSALVLDTGSGEPVHYRFAKCHLCRQRRSGSSGFWITQKFEGPSPLP